MAVTLQKYYHEEIWRSHICKNSMYALILKIAEIRIADMKISTPPAGHMPH